MSRFGARYFALFLEERGALSQRPALRGLYHTGALPTYNWIEVAETNEQVPFDGGRTVDIGADGTARLLELLVAALPPGGHIMVEYDSPQRAETALLLTRSVPALATPLGELLFRAGCGARMKDWQIAEGGAEGPRKLQAYKPPSTEIAARWRSEAASQLQAFLAQRSPSGEIFERASGRAAALLRDLTAPGR